MRPGNRTFQRDLFRRAVNLRMQSFKICRTPELVCRMPTVHEVAARLEEIAPLSGAEEWDNVGLLVGDRARPVRRLMTCLTVTPITAAEAIAQKADLVVVHHPLPFRPLARVTTETTVGRLLWDLIGAGVSVYSAHTAFDSAMEGINDQWARHLGLSDVECLVATIGHEAATLIGAGRCGVLPAFITLAELADLVKSVLSLERIQLVGSDQLSVRRIGLACGSGGSFLEAARAKGCECLVTGEANFHSCLEAEAMQMGLVLCGHFASERFAMEKMAEVLARDFSDINVWASGAERDPLRVR